VHDSMFISCWLESVWTHRSLESTSTANPSVNSRLYSEI